MLDVEGFIERNFPDYRHSGIELQICCPMCDDGNFHCYVNTEKGVCHCFKCGYSRSVVGLVMDVLGLPYYHAIGEVMMRPSLRHMDEKLERLHHHQKENPAYQVELPDGFQNLKESIHPAAQAAIKYLAKRKFSGWHIQRYNIGYSPSVPLRIIIPIEKEYWQGRRLLDWMEPKYINPKNPARDSLFNSQALTECEEVVICEGAFSAMAVGEQAIALLGKEAPEEKFSRLVDSDVKRFAVALDSDATAFALKLAERLTRSGKEVCVWNYNNGDPAENDGIIQHKGFSFRTKVEMKLKDKKR